jgi:hypothetical protein
MLIFVGVTALFPFFILLFLQINFSKVGDDQFQKKFETLYENTRTDSRMALTNSFNQMFRRLLFAVTAVFLMEYPFI